MPAIFDCPACGATLTPDGSKTHISCDYCGKTVLVPPELRAPEHPGAQAFSVNVTFGGAQPDRFTRAQALEIARLIRAGQKISAIKLHREISGMGLAESKGVIDNVETLLRDAGADDSGVLADQILESMTTVQPAVSAERRRVSGVIWLVAIVTLVLIVAGAVVPLVMGWFAVTRTVDAVVNAQEDPQRAPFTALTELPGVLSTAGAAVSIPTPGFARVVASHGSEGTGAGMFTDARAITTDGQGRVYVADYTGGRVQVFDAEGKFITQWLVDAEMPLLALAADRQGGVYVAQASKIRRYDGETGELLGEVQAPGSGGFDDVVVTPGGGLAAVYGAAGQDDILFFDADGNQTGSISGAVSSQTGSPELAMRIAVDGLGNVYILARFESAIFKYGPDGRFIDRWGGSGDQPGQLRSPYSIAADGQGRVYVGDFDGIEVFDSDGRYLDTIGGLESLAFGLAVDANGDILAAARTQWVRLRVE